MPEREPTHMQPQDPNQPVAPVGAPVAPPQPMAQPMPQPTMPPQQPMMQPAMGPMPMQPLPGGKKGLLKKILIPVIVLVVGVGVFLGLSFLKSPYPKYKAATPTSFNGYSVNTFSDWTKKDESSGKQKVLTYTSYVDEKKKDDKNIHAQHVILAQSGVIPKSQLVAEVKEEIISEFTKDSFFDGLAEEIKSCSTFDSKDSKSVDALKVKNAFVVIDLSFACPKSGDEPAIKGIGRLVVSNDGSLAVSLLAATDGAYTKNKVVLEDAALSIVKE
jgi:hypothetical protein